MHNIINEEGEWIQGEEEIAQTAYAHFEGIFTGEKKLINENTLECIPRIVSQEQNNHLASLPNMEELKGVIFSMNPISAGGPDGMHGNFFQKCWHIIKDDLMGVFKAFFS